MRVPPQRVALRRAVGSRAAAPRVGPSQVGMSLADVARDWDAVRGDSNIAIGESRVHSTTAEAVAKTRHLVVDEAVASKASALADIVGGEFCVLAVAKKREILDVTWVGLVCVVDVEGRVAFRAMRGSTLDGAPLGAFCERHRLVVPGIGKRATVCCQLGDDP